MSRSDVLELLRTAGELEKWVRTASQDGGGATLAGSGGTAEAEAGKRQQSPGQDLEPHWRLHLLRLKCVWSGEEGWRHAAEHCWEKEAHNAEEAQNDALAALNYIVKKETRYRFKLEAALSRQDEAVGQLASAVQRLEAVFNFPINFPLVRGMVGVKIWPEEMSEQDPMCRPKRRKYNARRAKVLISCLRLQRRILEELLPARALESADTSELRSTWGAAAAGELAGVARERAAAALRGLSEGRPANWEALCLIMGLMIAIVRGIKTDSTTNKFWSAFHGAFVNALRHAFCSIVRAGDRSQKGSDRPYLDWRLFAMLRSCCLGLDRASADPSEVRNLDSCYAAAAAQLRAHTLRVCGVVASDGGAQHRGQSWDAFDGFFAAMEPAMPIVESKWGSSREVPEAPPQLAERSGGGRRRASMLAAGPSVRREAQSARASAIPQAARSAAAQAVVFSVEDSDQEGC